jgi:hypothetical protein
MIEVRTGIRKTYRWQVGASRLRQASGRNPNRTVFRDQSQSLRAIGFHSGPRPLAGACWVGDRGSGSPRPRQCSERGTPERLPARMAMPDQALEDLARRCRSNSAEQDRQCEWHSQTGHERTRFGHAARTRQGMARASTWRARVALPAPGRCSVRWGRVRFELVHCESRHRKLGWIGVGVETVRLRSYASSGRSTHPAIRIRPEGRWRAR